MFVYTVHRPHSIKDTVAQSQFAAMDDFLDGKFANVSFSNFNFIIWIVWKLTKACYILATIISAFVISLIMIQRYAPKPKRTRRPEGMDFNTEETSYIPKRSLTVQSNKEIFKSWSYLKKLTW